VFDYVEIDSSFYRIPNVFAVKNWAKKTPKDFKFTAKFPKVITHDKRLEDVDKGLGRFFEAIRALSDKTLALLIQLPPSLHRKQEKDKQMADLNKRQERFENLIQSLIESGQLKPAA
jgi:uncharacterized protein YecE (DUF72 family)